MSDDNPYRVSPGAQGEQPQAVVQLDLRRSPSEWIVLVSLMAFPVFYGLTFVFSSFSVDESWTKWAWPTFGAFVAFGLVTLWLLWRRGKPGRVASIGFYAIQVVSITFPPGIRVRFNSLPTINLSFALTSGVTISLNVVALILFLLSIRVWREYAVDSDVPTTV